MEDAHEKAETKVVYTCVQSVSKVHGGGKWREEENGVCKAKIWKLLRNWVWDKVPKESCTLQ